MANPEGTPSGGSRSGLLKTAGLMLLAGALGGAAGEGCRKPATERAGADPALQKELTTLRGELHGALAGQEDLRGQLARVKSAVDGDRKERAEEAIAMVNKLLDEWEGDIEDGDLEIMTLIGADLNTLAAALMLIDAPKDLPKRNNGLWFDEIDTKDFDNHLNRMRLVVRPLRYADATEVKSLQKRAMDLSSKHAKRMLDLLKKKPRGKKDIDA